jgi:hypothetical protein
LAVLPIDSLVAVAFAALELELFVLLDEPSAPEAPASVLVPAWCTVAFVPCAPVLPLVEWPVPVCLVECEPAWPVPPRPVLCDAALPVPA